MWDRLGSVCTLRWGLGMPVEAMPVVGYATVQRRCPLATLENGGRRRLPGPAWFGLSVVILAIRFYVYLVQTWFGWLSCLGIGRDKAPSRRIKIAGMLRTNTTAGGCP